MRIVAFIDRSLYAQSVLDHASWLARANDASVDLVHVVSPNELIALTMPPIHPGGPVVLRANRTLDEDVRLLLDEARLQLEAARKRLVESGVDDVTVHLHEGEVLRHLSEAAMNGAIVVMGKRGEHADLARLPLGANFERLVRSTSTPVLAVSRLFRPIERMLVAMDLDQGAAHAVETIAAGYFPAAPVQLLHVGESSDAMQVELGRAATQLIGAGYPSTTEVTDGIARRVIPDRVVSDEVGLVAMGAFGTSRLQSVIFGSLTTELIRACQVPILLCH